MREVETERLLLRQLREEDSAPYASFFSDPEQAAFVGGECDRFTAWRRMAAVVGHWELKGFGFWALEEKSSGTFAGCAGLWFPSGWPEIELGYWLMPEMQGKGYATEASLRAREVAYENLGLKTLISLIDPKNKASIKVAERLGAVHEKTIPLLSFGPHGVYRHPSPEAL